MGIAGLPMAASVAANFIAVVLAVLFNKKYKVFGRPFFFNFAKLLASGGAMWAALAITRRFVAFSDSLMGRFFTLAVPALAGLAVYLICAVVLKTNEVRQLKQLISKGRN